MVVDMLSRSKFGAQSKTTRVRPMAIDITLMPANVSKYIIKFCKDTKVCDDVICANNAPLLAFKSEIINYGTIIYVDNLKFSVLEAELKHPIRCCKVRGFTVAMIEVDM